MAVEMHGMEILMLVIHHDLDDLAIFKYEWIAVDAVDHRICAVVANAEGSVERWDLLGKVGDVVDGETSNAVKGRVVQGHLYAPVHGFK